MKSVTQLEYEIEQLEAGIEGLQEQVEDLKNLLEAYYTNVAIGQLMDDTTDPLGVVEWEETMATLQRRAEELLDLNKEPAQEEFETETEELPYG